MFAVAGGDFGQNFGRIAGGGEVPVVEAPFE
jgi:hypothetical protein